MKKYIIIIILLIFIIIDIFSRVMSLLYPIDIIQIKCEEITSSVEKYKLNDNMELTDKIKEHPESYMVIRYDINIKNNTNRDMFIENYKYKIPYPHIYHEDGVEFYDQYELNSNEQECLRGIYVIDTKALNSKEIIQKIENKSKLKINYWVYLKKIPVFAKKCRGV